MTPEGRVKHKVKPKLEAVKAWYYMPVQNGLGKTGIPDFIACVPTVITEDMVGKRVGLFASVETKAPGKTSNTTKNQDREMAGIRRAGGLAVVVDDAEVLELALLVYTSTGDNNAVQVTSKTNCIAEAQTRSPQRLRGNRRTVPVAQGRASAAASVPAAVAVHSGDGIPIEEGVPGNPDGVPSSCRRGRVLPAAHGPKAVHDPLHG